MKTGIRWILLFLLALLPFQAMSCTMFVIKEGVKEVEKLEEKEKEKKARKERMLQEERQQEFQQQMKREEGAPCVAISNDCEQGDAGRSA